MLPEKTFLEDFSTLTAIFNFTVAADKFWKMALCRTGGLILKSIKPVLVNPCFVVPSSVNLQVRHAARKGYRDKARKAKSQAAVPEAVKKEVSRVIKKFTKIEKTVNLEKPEPPTEDDVILMNLFNHKKYSLSEAIKLHREYHHPEVYNSPNAPVTLKIEINMTGKKSTQFIKPFKGVATIPHPFVVSHKREVLVFCEPEDKELALACGASVAGGAEIIKKVQEGSIQPSLYEYVICHSNFFPNLTPIRQLLKDQIPKAKKGTLTNDLKTTIDRFLHGIEYSCVLVGNAQDFGFIHCTLGTLDMELHQLEENFKALLADIEKNRPPRDGDFISWIWCLCRPSLEEFAIDLSKYIETKAKVVDDDEEEEVLSEKQQEMLAAQKLMEESDEPELMKKEI